MSKQKHGFRVSGSLIALGLVAIVSSGCENPYQLSMTDLQNLKNKFDPYVPAKDGSGGGNTSGNTSGTNTLGDKSPYDGPSQPSSSPSGLPDVGSMGGSVNTGGGVSNDPYPDLAEKDPKGACDRLRALGDPAIVYENKPVDASVPDMSITDRNGGVVISSAETVTNLAHINGGIDVTARNVNAVSLINGGARINAVNVGAVDFVNGHTAIIASKVDSLGDNNGHTYLNVGSLQSVKMNNGFVAVIARASSAGVATIDSIEYGNGRLLVCGMNVKTILGINGKVTVVGGNVGSAQAVNGGITIIGGTLGSSSLVSGPIVIR